MGEDVYKVLSQVDVADKVWPLPEPIATDAIHSTTYGLAYDTAFTLDLDQGNRVGGLKTKIWVEKAEEPEAVIIEVDPSDDTYYSTYVEALPTVMHKLVERTDLIVVDYPDSVSPEVDDDLRELGVME